MNDAGDVPDAAAIQEAGEDGADATGGATCTIPALAQSSATCQVAHYVGGVTPCGPTDYDVYCSDLPAPSLGCVFAGNTPAHGSDYCCPCEGPDAGPACVNIDLSTYDRTCRSNADCIAIKSGAICSGAFLCANATINVDGRARYEQTIALLPPVGPNFHCPKQPPPGCGAQGTCTFPGENQ